MSLFYFAVSKFYFAGIFNSPSRGLILFCHDFYFILALVFLYFAVSLFYSAVSLLCGRSTYAVRTQYGPMRPHIVIVFQTLFVCLSLVRVPESRVTLGQWFNWEWGGLFRGGGVRKGVVFRNLGLFGQRLSAMVTNPLVEEFLKSWRVLLFFYSCKCWHKLRSFRSVSTILRSPVSASCLL